MGSLDFISRKLYQPTKIISKFDEEILVASLSRVHSGAQQFENIFAFYLNKFCLDNIPDSQTHITKQPIHDDQVLNIDPVRLVHLSQNLNSLAKQITTHKSRTNTLFVSIKHAFFLNKFCLGYIHDTQTHIPKQTTHDDQILIDPAPLVDPAPLAHLTQYLN